MVTVNGSLEQLATATFKFSKGVTDPKAGVIPAYTSLPVFNAVSRRLRVYHSRY